MARDLNLVHLEHIEQACERYDSGTALPERPAESLFLRLNGKRYPAGFIKELAYRLAIGKESDPLPEYDDDSETIRFYSMHGLAIESGSPPPQLREMVLVTGEHVLGLFSE